MPFKKFQLGERTKAKINKLFSAGGGEEPFWDMNEASATKLSFIAAAGGEFESDLKMTLQSYGGKPEKLAPNLAGRVRFRFTISEDDLEHLKAELKNSGKMPNLRIRPEEVHIA